jgi:hypothetical protein
VPSLPDGADNFLQHFVVPAADGWKVDSTVAGDVGSGLNVLLAATAPSVGWSNTRGAQKREDAKPALVYELPLIEGKRGAAGS